jgi:hypothetical protein
VKLRVSLTGALMVIALTLAVVELIRFGAGGSRINPGVLVIIVLLLAVRYAARRQAKKRSEILKAVPRRPLGLSDDDVS